MKLKIKNRKGQSITVLVQAAKNAKGLVFIMHGLSGTKDRPHIALFAQIFIEKGYTTVSFDTTNTFGESEGNYENATITNYYEDLEDVISWAKSQTWFKEPFFLAGHSVGGFCTAFYAQNHPGKVKALAPISTFVSGKLFLEDKPKKMIKDWQRTGWRIEESKSRPGLIKRLKWSFVEDSLKHDLLPQAKKLTMPVLLIVGSQDQDTSLRCQRLLYNKLPGKKELHIIKGAPHTFAEKQHLNQIKKIFSDWIDKI